MSFACVDTNNCFSFVKVVVFTIFDFLIDKTLHVKFCLKIAASQTFTQRAFARFWKCRHTIQKCFWGHCFGKKLRRLSKVVWPRPLNDQKFFSFNGHDAHYVRENPLIDQIFFSFGNHAIFSFPHFRFQNS